MYRLPVGKFIINELLKHMYSLQRLRGLVFLNFISSSTSTFTKLQLSDEW